VSLSLTLNYAREIYMLADTAGNRRLIQRYIDVYEYPDGRIEVRAGKGALPYVRCDKLPQIDTAAIVENKRLDHALRAAQAIPRHSEMTGAARHRERIRGSLHGPGRQYPARATQDS